MSAMVGLLVAVLVVLLAVVEVVIMALDEKSKCLVCGVCKYPRGASGGGGARCWIVGIARALVEQGTTAALPGACCLLVVVLDSFLFVLEVSPHSTTSRGSSQRAPAQQPSREEHELSCWRVSYHTRRE